MSDFRLITDIGTMRWQEEAPAYLERMAETESNEVAAEAFEDAVASWEPQSVLNPTYLRIRGSGILDKNATRRMVHARDRALAKTGAAMYDMARALTGTQYMPLRDMRRTKSPKTFVDKGLFGSEKFGHPYAHFPVFLSPIAEFLRNRPYIINKQTGSFHNAWRYSIKDTKKGKRVSLINTSRHAFALNGETQPLMIARPVRQAIAESFALDNNTVYARDGYTIDYTLRDCRRDILNAVEGKRK